MLFYALNGNQKAQREVLDNNFRKNYLNDTCAENWSTDVVSTLKGDAKHHCEYDIAKRKVTEAFIVCIPKVPLLI